MKFYGRNKKEGAFLLNFPFTAVFDDFLLFRGLHFTFINYLIVVIVVFHVFVAVLVINSVSTVRDP